MEEYMDRLGKKGVRWHEDVLGIGLIGTEVIMLRPSQSQGQQAKERNNWEIYTVNEGADDRPKQWFSMYGPEVYQMVMRIRALPIRGPM
ncbi:hypothetical protein GY45DRAFT_1327399 [Cubamyces sp. BRFM 1775]|nr:hypothetical protein GY45DRAFT_1327399 [Cubamyces sp. BRFM 1775]